MRTGRTWRTLFAALAVGVLSLVTAAIAAAEFGPIELVSKSTKEQANLATSPALSADGRYVAFSGIIGGRRGIFRKDLQTGAIALVAEASGSSEPLPEVSISADGRYVAFTTMARLDPKDDVQEGTSDVYVADMSTSPPTYELASARNGCNPETSVEPCGLTYADSEGLPKTGGSVAAGRVALSADGRRVAFITRAASNLTGNPEGTETPPGQVVVRDLETDQSTLMTVLPGTDQPVPGGGADPMSEGAAISADGGTVAWVGRHLPEQVPMLPDEEARVKEIEPEGPATSTSEEHEYHEPLWRRVPSAADPNPATRRIVGGGDPSAPGCPPDGTLSEPSCQGPFPELTHSRIREHNADFGFGFGTSVPQLSADGDTVAVIGNPDEDNDLFVVDMSPGLSRREAVRRLTHWVNPEPAARSPESPFNNKKNLPSLGEVTSCAISPEGNRIAFTTARQVFPVVPPTLITPPPPGPGELAELYQIDLRGETLERVTPGPGSAISAGPTGAKGAVDPSYSGNGLSLAFASDASNIVPGDTNEADDVFVVASPPADQAGQSSISPAPPALVVSPLRRLVASAVSRPNGRIRVIVGVPDTGTIRVKAESQLGSKLRTRKVASAHRQAAVGSSVQLELKLPRHLRELAHRKGGLFTVIAVTFSGPGGSPLHSQLDARFRVHRKKAKR